MSKSEILRDWEGAKDKKEQIQILADLNLTTTEAIKEVLLEMGVDGRRLPREKKREKAAETPKTQPKEGTIDDIIRDWEHEKGKKTQDQEAQPELLRAKNLEAPKHEKPKVEPRRKHALRRMEQLLQAVVTQEMADDIPDKEWVEELHDLWTDYYYKYWGEPDE